MRNISNLNDKNNLISINEVGLAKVYIYNSKKSMAIAAVEELRAKIHKILSTKNPEQTEDLRINFHHFLVFTL